ncbi:MAG: hypothetical protein UX85_C0003G0165 [Candidatus Beckwithbacteria bacterium GW2011_GWB1_47_15]|uniref:Uncharacterized protein n=1 Tax=Candidatus Beckwithbacteria bacterium GW2011_GWB1_47_15 TaxID=1618371 RepID=A0A0G1RWK8_9BACT|nr:MAG: hypothetical protein UY43_C0001G0295 [Candidatus Beckwithbacteria bacterium GW2011_GWC1_49_16]KKU35216.1 MAG: hypothetical protein UX50_C0005G0039 [Candidatus Beckwithbacteria bacterium GW2011_GWA1_46_30]KKU61506.1 MAG: hypothetical protein UX85_C0003G0165 [Candidatus Beckwithbacteria bacterium GW2011_GWB1_47_15]KKU71710.1 MAG: hypothetical protein UX97_C0004G0033 [Candidatus Beckwithbacteria bacterium GW2011_GWA2_47_25]KKW03808.1 MAG: hypothetical protein UY37_C0004G0101 [Candidatus Be
MSYLELDQQFTAKAGIVRTSYPLEKGTFQWVGFSKTREGLWGEEPEKIFKEARWGATEPWWRGTRLEVHGSTRETAFLLMGTANFQVAVGMGKRGELQKVEAVSLSQDGYWERVLCFDVGGVWTFSRPAIKGNMDLFWQTMRGVLLSGLDFEELVKQTVYLPTPEGDRSEVAMELDKSGEYLLITDNDWRGWLGVNLDGVDVEETNDLEKLLELVGVVSPSQEQAVDLREAADRLLGGLIYF